jgi:hypothetical protein
LRNIKGAGLPHAIAPANSSSKNRVGLDVTDRAVSVCRWVRAYCLSQLPIRSTASCISAAEPGEVVELDVEF